MCSSLFNLWLAAGNTNNIKRNPSHIPAFASPTSLKAPKRPAGWPPYPSTAHRSCETDRPLLDSLSTRLRIATIQGFTSIPIFLLVNLCLCRRIFDLFGCGPSEIPDRLRMLSTICPRVKVAWSTIEVEGARGGGHAGATVGRATHHPMS